MAKRVDFLLRVFFEVSHQFVLHDSEMLFFHAHMERTAQENVLLAAKLIGEITRYVTNDANCL